ncbi:MAG: hypothetical protein AAB509_01630 [Patescibacteria group bacterium]
MELSNFLAELWGISFVVIALAFLVKETYLKQLFAKIETEESLFCLGFVSFIIGLAMVLSHNIWVKDWRVVITIFGWASLLKGLSFLFLPEFVKDWIKKIESAQFVSYALIVIIFIGLALTYFGFTA